MGGPSPNLPPPQCLGHQAGTRQGAQCLFNSHPLCCRRRDQAPGSSPSEPPHVGLQDSKGGRLSGLGRNWGGPGADSQLPGPSPLDPYEDLHPGH